MDGLPAARRAAAWLHLAAAPTFALMAALVMLDGSPVTTCSGGTDSWPLGGMAPMYLLMGAFHLGPWLEVLSGRRGGPPGR